MVSVILDTGATTCCIDKNAVPKEALEENSYTVFFNGINSRQASNMKLKNDSMKIGENQFRIPFTYSFDMGMKDGIQMLIVCNFIRAMYGGVGMEGNTITLHKNVTTIDTRPNTEVSAPIIQELGLTGEEYIVIQKLVYYNLD